MAARAFTAFGKEGAKEFRGNKGSLDYSTTRR